MRVQLQCWIGKVDMRVSYNKQKYTMVCYAFSRVGRYVFAKDRFKFKLRNRLFMNAAVA